MKKALLLVIASLLIVAGCKIQKEEPATSLPPATPSQQTTPAPQADSLPPAIAELQTQPIPEKEKESITEIKIETVKPGIALYRGSWFDIEYPENFTASPLTPTNTYDEVTLVQTNEARFTSPDGTVEFYIFSPLWGEDPDDYLEVGPAEEFVSEKDDESIPDTEFDKRIVRWVTVKATDGSYFRSYVSIRDQFDTGFSLHHVFGIKYKDNASYEKYKDSYVSFKNSLRQYAD